jgi:hypothetical protein
MSIYHWDWNGFKVVVGDDDDDVPIDNSAIKINKLSDCSPAYLQYQQKILEWINRFHVTKKFKTVVKKLGNISGRNTYDACPL